MTTPRRFHTDFRYTDRAGKASYIASKYAPLFATSVLDVGCDQKQLAGAIGPGVKYVGVDMNAAADVVVDLEHGKLPFVSRSFETVIAADVLEHLDATHAVFDELCRVADRWVIASLPNPYRNFLMELARQGVSTFKYYGLGPVRPVDRHKWFFGGDDAIAYFEGCAARNGFVVEQIDAEEIGWPAEVRAMLPGLTPTNQLAAGTIWCVLSRQSPGQG